MASLSHSMNSVKRETDETVWHFCSVSMAAQARNILEDRFEFNRTPAAHIKARIWESLWETISWNR
jgi:hypothetical protein